MELFSIIHRLEFQKQQITKSNIYANEKSQIIMLKYRNQILHIHEITGEKMELVLESLKKLILKIICYA